MTRCDARGVAFSIGSACHGVENKNSKKPSNHVLAAIGLDKYEAREVVRLSFSGETSIEDAEDAASIIADEALRLLESAPPAANADHKPGPGASRK